MSERFQPFATATEHARAAGNPPTRYVAINRAVMLGQVFICRAPSHEKAKKLARIFTNDRTLILALRSFMAASVEMDDSHLRCLLCDALSTGDNLRLTHALRCPVRQAEAALENCEAV